MCDDGLEVCLSLEPGGLDRIIDFAPGRLRELLPSHKPSMKLVLLLAAKRAQDLIHRIRLLGLSLGSLPFLSRQSA
jgi:hypothetical protein